MCITVVAAGCRENLADVDFNGYRITAPSIITADEILDIVKSKDGSRVSLYQGPPWAKSAALRKSVRDCL